MHRHALSLTALHLGTSTSSLSVCPPPFGGRDTKGEHTPARLILVLSAGAIAPTAGSRFLLFPELELPLCPQTSVCCKPRAALSLTREGHVPAPAWRSSKQLRCYTRTSQLEYQCCHQGDVNCLLWLILLYLFSVRLWLGSRRPEAVVSATYCMCYSWNGASTAVSSTVHWPTWGRNTFPEQCCYLDCKVSEGDRRWFLNVFDIILPS